jgi:hypothetical protein
MASARKQQTRAKTIDSSVNCVENADVHEQLHHPTRHLAVRADSCLVVVMQRDADVIV